jgi:hypothetical protein
MNPTAMGRKLSRTAWLGALIVMIPDSARGDATMLAGLMSAGGPRPSVGLAYDDCPSGVGFEITYLGRLGGETADQSCGRNIFASLIVRPPTISTAAAIAQTRESPVSVTAFTGVAIAPGPHAAIGIAVGVKSRQTPLSVEFEYSRSRSEPGVAVPAIETFAGNLLIQLPTPPARFQFYGTVGVGFYALLLNHHSSEPSDARNFGGGAKVTLGGPVKRRIDYRAVLLTPIVDEDHSNEHRLYVGIVAGF